MTVDIQAARAHLQAREQQLMMEREQRRQRAAQAAREAARVVMPTFPQIRKAYLFGSVTHHGAMRRDSDIDVAIEDRLDAADYFALWRELERAMPGWELDLVELDDGLPFAESVRAEGEVIYERQV